MIDIHPTATIDCDDFDAGDGTIVRAHATIQGAKVHLGRECFIDQFATIGGGSNRDGSLTAGDWLHLGQFAQVNIARRVTIGHEVGLGVGTRVFTHGAYLSEYDGFPCSFADVTIGDQVWLPNAIVMPGVSIGSHIVAAAGSIVTDDLESHNLYAGAPARLVRAGCYPTASANAGHLALLRVCGDLRLADAQVTPTSIHLQDTAFDVAERIIAGRATEESERLRNQLRRHGIRFRFRVVNGTYHPWT